MLKRKDKIIIVIGILFLIWVTYLQHKGDVGVNDNICETVKMAIKGIITETQGRDPYDRIYVNNIKDSNMIWVNTSKDLSVKGFKGDYNLMVGDSVIKQANSKIITFKRGDSLVVSVLNCND